MVPLPPHTPLPPCTPLPSRLPSLAIHIPSPACLHVHTDLCVFARALSPPTSSPLPIYLIPSHGYAQPAPQLCSYCRNPTSLAPLLGGMSIRVLFKLLSIVVLLSRPPASPGRFVNQPTMNTGPSPSMLWFLSVVVSVSSSLVTAGCSAIE